MSQLFCLITGASSGIGKATALKLGAANRNILVNHFQQESEGKEVVRQITAAGGHAQLIDFDVTDSMQVQEKLGVWLSESGNEIDTLINNAGVARVQDFAACDSATWNHVIDVKLKGFYNVTQMVLPAMRRRRHGRIVNIASWVGTYGQKGLVNYAAANAGIIAATKSLAKEIACDNITVNAVAPGFIDTPLLKDADLAAIVREIPANRLGKPEEVASLVRFLISEKAGYINGEVIGIDGGL